MSKKSLITDEERALFRDAVKNVMPLAIENKLLTYQQHKPISTLRGKTKIYDLNHSMLSKATPSISLRQKALAAQIGNTQSPVNPETSLMFFRAGLQNRVKQRLKKGLFPVQAVLDLHGFDLVTAEETVNQFLYGAIAKQWRCVKIIHGKGAKTGQEYPLLKNGVNRWLREYASVLAFCSARANEGGTGAVYVLLQSKIKT